MLFWPLQATVRSFTMDTQTQIRKIQVAHTEAGRTVWVKPILSFRPVRNLRILDQLRQQPCGTMQLLDSFRTQLAIFFNLLDCSL